MAQWNQLWNVKIIDPDDGRVWDYKYRAPSEAILRDRIEASKPGWAILLDSYGQPMIYREGTQ